MVQIWTNLEMLTRYACTVCLFEYIKDEETTLRDFRITLGDDSGEMVEAFVEDMQAVAVRYLFATKGTTRARPNAGTHMTWNEAHLFTVAGCIVGLLAMAVL
jgi:hypothetical protein